MRPFKGPLSTVWSVKDVLDFTFSCAHYCVDIHVGRGDVWIEAVSSQNEGMRKLLFYRDGAVGLHKFNCQGAKMSTARVGVRVRDWWEALAINKAWR